jgi:hypothetical protein
MKPTPAASTPLIRLSTRDEVTADAPACGGTRRTLVFSAGETVRDASKQQRREQTRKKKEYQSAD